MPRSARSFADDIRARSDADLRALLAHRPDLSRPAPADLTTLAARAATRASVQRALDGLEADQLHVLEAVMIAGPGGAVAPLLGVSTRRLRPLLDGLWQTALLWRSPEGLRPARAVGELIHHPARLGPPAAELGATIPADVDAAYAGLTPSARNAVDRLRWTHPTAAFTGAAGRAALTELVEAGIMTRTEEDSGVIPREVGLALRGGQLYADPLGHPEPSGKVVPPSDVDAAAGAESLDLLWRVEELAELWEKDPPRVLRSGGLSVRDHRIATAALDASPELSAFVIEVAAAGGLIASDGRLEPSWLPTSAFDDWSAATRERRLGTLVTAWWESIRAPFLAGTSNEQGVINVLGPGVDWPMMRHRRRDVLKMAASLPPGTVADSETVDELLRWSRPLRLPDGVPTRADVILQEAAWLGLTGRGALSSAGRALVEGRHPDEAIANQLPSPVGELLLQADLTAIAPGPLEDDLRRLMHRAADVESRGGATVFRFSSVSVRRAFDAGVTADELESRLRQASPSPLPQPLTYLIGDVARRHGRTRVGSADSYVRSDDETTLSAMLADRGLAPLQLRRIAPTVLASSAAPGTVLEMLRDQHYSPVAETSDGGVVTASAKVQRAPVPRHGTAPVTMPALDADAAETLISKLRSAESEHTRSSSAATPRIPSTDPSVTLNMLQDAAAEQIAVWIGYVDGSGDLRRTLFTPHRVEGGRATGITGDDASRTFSIHRITGVAEA